MAALKARVQAFDWLRGLAVLFMIQCHALVLLDPATKADPLYRLLQRLDGLVAPAFIFSAGFSLALVQCRAALKGGDRAVRARKSLRRIGEVALVATTINCIWFPVLHEPHWLWRLDILHCIAISLLGLWALLLPLASRPVPLRWVAFTLAMATFAVSPLLESGLGPLDAFFNQTTGAQFPLVPWAGYVFLGASAGAVAAGGELTPVVRWLAVLLCLGAVMWALSGQLEAAYPPHHFWVTNPANAAQRWTLVTAVLLALLALERFVPSVSTRLPVRLVEALGTSSMAAYFFHEMLLFLRVFGFSFDARFHASAQWPLYWLLTAVVVLLTLLLVLGADRLYRRYDRALG